MPFSKGEAPERLSSTKDNWTRVGPVRSSFEDFVEISSLLIKKVGKVLVKYTLVKVDGATPKRWISKGP